MIRVFLLDDHELVRRGIRDLLDGVPDVVFAGEAAKAGSALQAVRACRPDVALLDVRLPDGDGISVCRDIRSEMPEVSSVMLTSYQDDQALFGAIMAGAAGFFLKQTHGHELIAAVRRVAAGQSLIDPAVTGRLLDRLRLGVSDDPFGKLTQQEQTVLRLVAEGMTNRQIAGEIHLAEKTVKNYVSSILFKLGMQHRTEAALYAARVLQPS